MDELPEPPLEPPLLPPLPPDGEGEGALDDPDDPESDDPLEVLGALASLLFDSPPVADALEVPAGFDDE